MNATLERRTRVDPRAVYVYGLHRDTTKEQVSNALQCLGTVDSLGNISVPFLVTTPKRSCQGHGQVAYCWAYYNTPLEAAHAINMGKFTYRISPLTGGSRSWEAYIRAPFAEHFDSCPNAGAVPNPQPAPLQASHRPLSQPVPPTFSNTPPPFFTAFHPHPPPLFPGFFPPQPPAFHGPLPQFPFASATFPQQPPPNNFAFFTPACAGIVPPHPPSPAQPSSSSTAQCASFVPSTPVTPPVAPFVFAQSCASPSFPAAMSSTSSSCSAATYADAASTTPLSDPPSTQPPNVTAAATATSTSPAPTVVLEEQEEDEEHNDQQYERSRDDDHEQEYNDDNAENEDEDSDEQQFIVTRGQLLQEWQYFFEAGRATQSAMNTGLFENRPEWGKFRVAETEEVVLSQGTSTTTSHKMDEID
ncbi:hypothetical protein Pelo_11984 [Pelomyxa schiedti]|nr:hypothetical protein Pelo_11984 [Pelomyxa schiedti]